MKLTDKQRVVLAAAMAASDDPRARRIIRNNLRLADALDEATRR